MFSILFCVELFMKFYSSDFIVFNSVIQRIAVREHAQETPIAHLSFGKKSHRFLQFSLQNSKKNPLSDATPKSCFIHPRKNNKLPGEAPPKLRLWRHGAREVLLLSLREEGSPLGGRVVMASWGMGIWMVLA